jgi:hypothetical protein
MAGGAEVATGAIGAGAGAVGAMGAVGKRPMGAAAGVTVAVGAGAGEIILIMGATGAAVAKWREMESLAADVPSTPQVGQAIEAGILPSTGSTSNAYRCPHSHSIFTGTIGLLNPFIVRENTLLNRKILVKLPFKL